MPRRRGAPAPCPRGAPTLDPHGAPAPGHRIVGLLSVP
ncbi:hypothetical protein L841_3689 [Mycobacterium sp. MAC_080597_8934]|nr:hypothetical protein L839_0821 [Mycobacterium avium MAV_120809_2495]ETZ52511.1 hypothetical protein L840_5019 [Mycobacterium sp. MAC_011194_8550]ETZ65177.1 hypothetical protein L841_3689 [Mycobacterium sp. MAC_080597_8934]